MRFACARLRPEDRRARVVGVATDVRKPGRTLVVGVGSSLRGDDGVGLHVVRRLRDGGLPQGWSAIELAGGWLSLLDHIEGVETLVVVDALEAGLQPGTVVEVASGLAGAARSWRSCGHLMGLEGVLELARGLGLEVPRSISVIGVQVGDLRQFSERCSPEVESAIGPACALVLKRADD